MGVITMVRELRNLVMVKGLQILVMDIRGYIMFVIIMVIIMVKDLRNLDTDMDIKESIMSVTIMVITMVKELQSLVMDIREYTMYVIIMATTMVSIHIKSSCTNALRVQYF